MVHTIPAKVILQNQVFEIDGNTGDLVTIFKDDWLLHTLLVQSPLLISVIVDDEFEIYALANEENLQSKIENCKQGYADDSEFTVNVYDLNQSWLTQQDDTEPSPGLEFIQLAEADL